MSICDRSFSSVIPKTFCHLPKLETLSLRLSNLAGSFPSCFGSLSTLQSLHIFSSPSHSINNFGGYLPSSFWSLQQLKTLKLESILAIYGLTTPSDANLPNLEEFSIQSSRYFSSSLSELLQSAKKLRILNLSGSKAKLDGNTLAGLNSLEIVDLSSMDAFIYIPQAFWEAKPNLRRVTFAQSSRIKSRLGPNIGNLTSLTFLDLTGSEVMGTIPPAIVHCPLEQIVISETRLEHPIPNNIGLLQPTLRYLHISNLIRGPSTVPASIGQLTRLSELIMNFNNFNGTLPSLINITTLRHLFVHHNALTGELPPLGSLKSVRIDANNNQLSGPIPRWIASKASKLDLSHNQLSGEMEFDLFTANHDLTDIVLAHNRFSGPLPPFSVPLNHLDFSNNKFTGDLPHSYCNMTALDVSHNTLSGNLSALLSPDCLFETMNSLHIGYNSFVSAFPSVSHLTRLQTLAASYNQFNGDLPELPGSLKLLDLSSNNLDGMNARRWVRLRSSRGLKYLDLSRNFMDLKTVSYADFLGPNMTYLSLAHNQLSRPSQDDVLSYNLELTGLDLTNTTFDGSWFGSVYYPNLALFKIGHNAIQGNLPLHLLRSLTQLDISFNEFYFDISILASLPFLSVFEAQRNYIFGSLVLADLPNLLKVNLANNTLHSAPNLISIGNRFSESLQSLDISGNSLLPKIKDLETRETGLARGISSAPSRNYSKSVSCFELVFFNKTGQSFIFDEDLFDYVQCDCSQGYFGSPPSQCHHCPSQGITSCEGPLLSITGSYYVYLQVALPSSEMRKTHRSTTNWIDSFAISSFYDLLSTQSASETIEYSESSSFSFETESCLVTTVQTLSGRSNCFGINITADDLSSPQVPVTKLLETQCAPGSDGRLCSRCQCDTENCWFARGPTCAKCRRVFRLSTSIPLLVCLTVVLLAIMSVIMAVILRRKRKQSLIRFDKLPLLKRIFYRLVHLTTLGNISILVTFLQMLIGFTQWDAYAKVNFLSVLNGVNEGLGLRCLFPFLADPLWDLIIQLSTPFVAIVLLTISIVIGGQIARVLEAREREKRFKRSSLLHDQDDLDSDHEEPLIAEKEDEILIEYPTLALLTSLSITAIKFFYFGTALAAHEYLFSSVAPSGLRYVQGKPWMLHSQSWSLMMASLPAILIFDFAIPVTFIVICWKFRHTFKLSSVQVYFGSLFETYNQQCFWWEIVNTLRKLSIALVMRAFTANDAIQSVLVVTILTATQVSQLTLQPWRRKTENLADGVSSVLLIAALIYTRPAHFLHTPEVIWYIFALSICFVLLSVATIAWKSITETTEYDKRLTAITQSHDSSTRVDHVLGEQSMEEVIWTDVAN